MARAKLRNGVIGAAGGKREGAGRTPDWFREKCQSLLDKHKLLDFVAQVASGKSVEVFVTESGNAVDVPAKVKDRISAIQFLADRAFGKPKEHHEISGHLTLEQILGEAHQ